MTKFFKFKAEVVTGKCPTCEEDTLLVGLSKEYYRCMNCGADLEQHVNGKISYIPTLNPKTLKSTLNKYFDGEEV
jgi:ribosomal protein S27E